MGKYGKPPAAAQPVVPKLPSPAGQIGPQVAAILGLSLVLGLAFNASNPIGIRWNTATAANPSRPSNLSNAVAAAAIRHPTAAKPSFERPVSPAPSALPPLPIAASPSPSPNPQGIQVGSAGVPAQPTPGLIPALTPSPSLAGNPPIQQPAPPAIASLNTQTSAVVGLQTNQQSQYMADPLSTTWAEAKPLVDAGKAVLLDARVKAAYEAAHIPGAISLPETSTLDEFNAFVQRCGTNRTIIVYCSSTSCSISRRVAYRLMREFGFQSVRYMTGGFQEWQKAELSAPKQGS